MRSGEPVVLSVKSNNGTRIYGGEITGVEADKAVVLAFPKDTVPFTMVLRPQSGRGNFIADSDERVDVYAPIGTEFRSIAACKALSVKLATDMNLPAAPEAPIPQPVKKVRESKPATNPGVCCCGCGGATKGGKFISGHDARCKSLLKAIIAGEKPRTEISPELLTSYASMGFVMDTKLPSYNPGYKTLLDSEVAARATVAE